MNYLYIALALCEVGKEITAANMRRVLAALGVKADDAEMEFFTSALAILSRTGVAGKRDLSVAGPQACAPALPRNHGHSAPVNPEEERMAVALPPPWEQKNWQERLERLEGSVAAIQEWAALSGQEPARSPVVASLKDGCAPDLPGQERAGDKVDVVVASHKAAAGDGDARYIYGIADEGVDVSLGPIGLEGSDVYTVAYEGVCAIVHDCSAQPYRSDDDQVVKGWVLTHQKVLDEAAERFGALLPMGFDTIIQGQDGTDPGHVLQSWLAENYDDIQEKMARVRGKQEFGVQILWDPRVIGRQIAEASEELKALEEEMQSSPKGTAYMHKLKLEKLLKESIEEKADACFKEFYARIKEQVDDIVVGKTKKIDEDKQMLMNLSCLVRKDKVAELGEELERIEDREGFSVRFTGPWPPFSFVTPTGIRGKDE